MKQFVFFIFLIQTAYSQSLDSLTLNTCYQIAFKNYPLNKDKELYLQANELKIKNIQTNYLPAINLSAQATYQSDVTAVKIPIPNVSMPSPTKDQYKIFVDVNQMLYDGSATHSQKELEKINLATDNQNIEVQLYQLRDRINQVYFMILLFQQQEEIFRSVKSSLEVRQKSTKSAIANGILPPVNQDIIKAEMLKVDQQLVEVEEGRKSSLLILAELMSMSLPENIKINTPNFSLADSLEERPEYAFFDLQKSKIQALSNITETKRMPKIAAFAQAGYGKPALNMFKDEFEPYYIVGARLTWNIWDWNTIRREKQILTIQGLTIDTQKSIFMKNIMIGLQREASNIQRLMETINIDNDIIATRSKIVAYYESQHENGIIKSTDYITELNNETQAKLTKEVHKIQLLQAKANYLTLKGK